MAIEYYTYRIHKYAIPQKTVTPGYGLNFFNNSNMHDLSSDLALVAESILLSLVKPPSYLWLKTTILEDTDRSDSRWEHRLCYRSARTRTLDASIVATSRGPCGPDGPHAPDESITYVNESRSTINFTYLCSAV
jgi:hypothetical protein